MRRKNSEEEEFEPLHEHDRFLILVCLVASLLVGYVFTNYVSLLGA
jgi:hypothetical protein